MIRQISRSSLDGILARRVCDVSFSRRIKKPYFPLHRRMLCTNNMSILGSVAGRTTLNFRPPLGYGPSYDPVEKNLIIVWDILVQDYRNINCNYVNLNYTWEDNQFWNDFELIFSKMNGLQKVNFMKQMKVIG